MRKFSIYQIVVGNMKFINFRSNGPGDYKARAVIAGRFNETFEISLMAIAAVFGGAPLDAVIEMQKAFVPENNERQQAEATLHLMGLKQAAVNREEQQADSLKFDNPN